MLRCSTCAHCYSALTATVSADGQRLELVAYPLQVIARGGTRFNGGVQLLALDAMRASLGYMDVLHAYAGKLLPPLTEGGALGSLGDQTLYSWMSVPGPARAFLHVLPCGWNRQTGAGLIGVEGFWAAHACDSPCRLIHTNQLEHKALISKLQADPTGQSCYDVLEHQRQSNLHFHDSTRVNQLNAAGARMLDILQAECCPRSDGTSREQPPAAWPAERRASYQRHLVAQRHIINQQRMRDRKHGVGGERSRITSGPRVASCLHRVEKDVWYSGTWLSAAGGLFTASTCAASCGDNLRCRYWTLQITSGKGSGCHLLADRTDRHTAPAGSHLHGACPVSRGHNPTQNILPAGLPAVQTPPMYTRQWLGERFAGGTRRHSCMASHPWIGRALNQFFAASESVDTAGLTRLEVTRALREADWRGQPTLPGKLEVTLRWSSPRAVTITSRNVHPHNQPFKPANMLALLKRAVSAVD